MPISFKSLGTEETITGEFALFTDTANSTANVIKLGSDISAFDFDMPLHFKEIRHYGDRIVATHFPAGYTQAYISVYVSNDGGANWTKSLDADIETYTNDFTRLGVSNNGVFYLVRGNQDIILTSTDGLSWTVGNLPILGKGNDIPFGSDYMNEAPWGLVHSKGTYALLPTYYTGSNIPVSTDLVTWTTNPNGGTIAAAGLASAPAPKITTSGATFVRVGVANGLPLEMAVSTGPLATTSWTNVSSSLSTAIFGISGGQLMSGFSDRIGTFAYGNTLFIHGKDSISGKIVMAYSTNNGGAWTAYNLSADSQSIVGSITDMFVMDGIFNIVYTTEEWNGSITQSYVKQLSTSDPKNGPWRLKVSEPFVSQDGSILARLKLRMNGSSLYKVVVANGILNF